MSEALLGRVDVVVVTAAEGEDVALRGVDEGAVSAWEEIPRTAAFPFPVWLRTYRSSKGTIRVLLTKALEMGVEASMLAATKLVTLCKPRCIAMCGVCAGRPGWTDLGDVIVADRVYRYDSGDVREANGERTFRPDHTTYQIPAAWKQPAQRMVVTAHPMARPPPTNRRSAAAVVADGVARWP
jgi:nucleoside phosphorylase